MAKNSIKDYFSICPIVQDQTREPNEEPEDLCKHKELDVNEVISEFARRKKQKISAMPVNLLISSVFFS